MSAAVASLQAGQGPLGNGQVSCSSRDVGSEYCATSQGGAAASAAAAPAWNQIVLPAVGPRFGTPMIPFDYSLSNNGPVSITTGSSGTVTITATLTAGTAQFVTLSCVSGGLLAGITCGSFVVNPVTPSLTGAASLLTVNVGSSVAAGSYNFMVIGSPVSATVPGTTTVTVTVTTLPFDFSLSAPSSVTLDQGTTTIGFPVLLTLTSGSTSPVTISVTSTLPSGVTATVGNSPCSPSCAARVSFKATTTATIGTATVKIQAVGGGVTKTASISLTVLIAFDFSLSNPSPSSLTVTQGSTSQSSSITATTVSGTPTRGVGFIATTTSLPAGITPIYTNDPCNPSCTVTISFSTNDAAAPGTFTITILAIGSDLGSRYAYITLTIIAPSVSTVSCGHDLSCSVQSNATLSNIRFAGITIHVEADGPSGDHGYANVTVPKTAIPNVGNMHVFVDNAKLASSAVSITSNSTDYFIYFTFTFHSPVLIDIQLTSPAPEPTPNAPTIFGLDPILLYEIIGALVAAFIVISAVLLTLRRRRTRPTASLA